MPSQEKSIDLGGVDVSNTSQFSISEWAPLCSQLKAFPADMKPLVARCSGKMAKLFDAAENDCPEIDDPGTDTAGREEDQNKALCQTLTTVVYSIHPVKSVSELFCRAVR